MSTDQFVLAHIKRCHLCQKHDRLVASGSQYRNEVELERYANHVRSAVGRIKIATEDAELRMAYDRTHPR
ncbi:hypothetical protein LCGC14_1203380 [marine sediment metagenome]|uniref:Uncharacterized protein n=1 Tax=marine sediment metagenome TaxID=412755 RepID=A0A0F9NYL9_9ZZZZ